MGFAFLLRRTLARLERQIAFETILRCLPNIVLEPTALTWRTNLGLLRPDGIAGYDLSTDLIVPEVGAGAARRLLDAYEALLYRRA